MHGSRDSARHARAKDIFVRALDVPADERGSFLARECAADDDLRRDVQELLAHESVARDGFLDASSDGGPVPPPTRLRIPGFRLLAVHGDGTSGVVFRAEQQSPRREVAVKVLRLDSRVIGQVPRFQREAELLGRLSHPGIAQVFESGVADTDAGPLPWIALEFVRGVTLLRHVREEALAVDAVLRLFVELCEAVDHAHQRGIVHLDLKPSNVLVDANGRVKVLDFGIARSLEDERAAADLTRSGLVLGTVAYMAPEQARGERSSIGASADVYALGVMLHEALCGELPLPIDATRVFEAVRIVCEEPPKRLRSMRRDLPRDLESILLEALRKEPERRYATAGMLASDLRNLLEHRPVRARRPGMLYRAMRFVRRNRALTAAMAVVLMSLSAALTSSLRGLEAERRTRARTSETLEAVASKLFDLAPTLGFGEPQRPGLEEVAARIAAQLDIDPRNDALRRTRARALFELAILDCMIEDHTRGEDRARQAAALLEDLVQRHPTSHDDWSLLSRTYVKIGEARRDLGDVAGQFAMFERAFELDARLVREHPDEGELIEDLGWSHSRMIELALARGRPDLARDFASQRLADAERLHATEPTNWKYVFNLSHAQSRVADFAAKDGDIDRASALAAQATRLSRDLVTQQPSRRDFIHWHFFACQIAMVIAEQRGDRAAAYRFAKQRCIVGFDLCYGDPRRLEHLEIVQGGARDLVRCALACGEWEDASRSSAQLLEAIRMARESGVEPELCDGFQSNAEELADYVAAVRPTSTPARTERQGD